MRRRWIPGWKPAAGNGETVPQVDEIEIARRQRSVGACRRLISNPEIVGVEIVTLPRRPRT
jgi:hypothetical protein